MLWLMQELINVYLVVGCNFIVIYVGSVVGNFLFVVNVVCFLFKFGQVVLVGELLLVWQFGLGGGGVLLLELLLVLMVDLVLCCELVVGQLDDFILVSQWCFNVFFVVLVFVFVLVLMCCKKWLVVYLVELIWSFCLQICLICFFVYLWDEWELVWGIQNGQLQSNYLVDVDLILLYCYIFGLMLLDVLCIIFSFKVFIIYEFDDLFNEILVDYFEVQ